MTNNELKALIEEYLRKIKELEVQKNNLEAEMDRKAQQAEMCISKFTEENRELRIRLEKTRETSNQIPEYEEKIRNLSRTVDELTDKMHHDFKSQSSTHNRLRDAES